MTYADISNLEGRSINSHGTPRIRYGMNEMATVRYHHRHIKRYHVRREPFAWKYCYRETAPDGVRWLKAQNLPSLKYSNWSVCVESRRRSTCPSQREGPARQSRLHLWHPQLVQRSRCPPSAAVRQREIASNTFWCCQLIHLRLCSMKDSPAQRTISAISMRGRLMSCACFLLVKRT